MQVERTSDQFLSRSAGLAGRYDVGRAVLSTCKETATRRTVCDVVTDQALRFGHSCKYRGRLRARKHAVVHSVSSDRAGLSEGIGDTPDSYGEGRVARRQARRA